MSIYECDETDLLGFVCYVLLVDAYSIYPPLQLALPARKAFAAELTSS